MKIAFALFALLTISSCLDWETELLKEDPVTLQLFNDYMNTYDKSYGTLAIMLARLQIFKENLLKIEELNEEDNGAEFAITEYTDMTTAEFARTYRNLRLREVKDEDREMIDISDLDTESFADSIDWRDQGAVTAVKNQGSCGSCWAFSAVANLESQYFLQKGTLKVFSEQQLVDCENVYSSGCDGGEENGGMDHWKTHGFILEADYKYTHKTQSCKENSHTSQGKVAHYTKDSVENGYLSHDETVIAAYVAKNGPVSVAVNANQFQFYNKGVLDPSNCKASGIDHAVTVVGYGNESGKDYWLIKNSWSASWGEAGYVKLRRGTGACGVNIYASSITSFQ